MKRKDIAELIRLLNLFFNEYSFNDKGFTSKNPIAILLKEKLSNLGRWKNLPRGDGYGRWKPDKELDQNEFLRRYEFKTQKKKPEPPTPPKETPPSGCPF
jgi:hypothetical protein